ncbi:trypsin [Magnetospirillum sp. ME-1]|uniref:Magnetosome formation protease MamE n=2 Tax=Alphaproteobacteria TaxID=28211 RepID=MAME_PARM1|nr:RecName: Full=Magnetosome formation protease MamE; AltName: Full=Magnetochrome MamE; AltName: Full=Magnetosome serine protease MamE [Paramagnetospirillum magneticum AMB-1]ARJ64559.1 trypsin [Magnetospirillum sp. ME-1]BAE49767.1 Trypsin-like serine protease, typically periplasmic [Paramagnetospirillum magneticum AMB-1]
MAMFNGDVEDGGRGDASCGKDLKRYLMLMGVVALVVLFGAFIYRQSSGGLRLGAMLEQMGRGTGPAVNVPVQQGGPSAAVNPAMSVPAGARVAPPSAAGAIATMPPMVDFGPAPIGAGGPFSSVVTLLRNSVVAVTASSANGQAMPDPLGLANPDGLPHFANPATRSVENIGTGVIVRNDGFIVTNYHVVRGANSVFVTVQDDVGSTRYSAEIIKMDEALDLALLKVAPKTPLTAAVLGDSDGVQVADEVIAIGTPFGLDMTVSRGIISAKRKSMVIEGVTHSNLLQTDAAINQGNSGGPLVISNGTVVGINTAIYTPNGAFAGIGFAVPSNQARLFILDEVGWLPTSTAEGASMGLVAMQRPMGGGVGAAGPAIFAGTRAPHTDGRQNMDCTTCHDLIPAGNGRPAPMMPIAAPIPPPPIPMGAVSPHTDGRQNMNCANCHQMLGGAAPIAAPGLGGGAYRFAQPPGSLAINIQGPRGGQSTAAGTGRVTLLGAALTPMSQRLGAQTGVPVGRGVFISGVTPNTPAATAGLRPGDVLLKVDGRPVRLPEEVSAIMVEMHAGRSVRLGVLRDGDVRNMTLVAGPAGLAAAAVQAPAIADMAQPPMGGMAPTAPGMVAVPGGPAVMPKPPTEFNWLGMEIETFQAPRPITGVPGAVPVPGAKGAQVAEVLVGSRAAVAGLQANDLILEVNNRPVAGPARLDAAIKGATNAGQQILLKVNRNGQEFWIVL